MTHKLVFDFCMLPCTHVHTHIHRECGREERDEG